MTTRVRLVAGVAVLGLGALVAAPRLMGDLPDPLAPVIGLVERQWSRFVPPSIDEANRLAGLTAPEREALRTAAPQLDGFLVWSSNRSGNHELYRLDFPEGRVRRLTDDPHVDFYARISPDGQRLVFLRSQRPWVSFRDEESWDVYVMQADGRAPTRVARSGYHPTWSPDGQAIVFLQAGGDQVVRLDLATGRETVLLDGPRTATVGGRLQTPYLSPDGRRLALTVRSRAFNGVAVLELADGRLARVTGGQACQLTFTPGGTLVWVEPGGRGGTRLMTVKASGDVATVLIDLPGRHSHEYFPSFSPDGQWLVWGAAAEGHEHDRADYELFLWRVGAPPELAIRLTHHPGNDQWPAIWATSRRVSDAQGRRNESRGVAQKVAGPSAARVDASASMWPKSGSGAMGDGRLGGRPAI